MEICKARSLSPVSTSSLALNFLLAGRKIFKWPIRVERKGQEISEADMRVSAVGKFRKVFGPRIVSEL